MPQPRPRVVLAALVLTAVTACGGSAQSGGTADDDGPPSTAASVSPAPSEQPGGSASGTPGSSAAGQQDSGPRLQVRIADGTVEPTAERVQVRAGEEITVQVTSDRAGELHVHASPEQMLTFPAGKSEHSLTLEQPGVVEVETHHPEHVVFQLEVR